MPTSINNYNFFYSPSVCRMEGKKLFTWQDLTKLNQWDNPHVAYKGKVYDITDYVNQHPGGREQIMIAAGRDMTQLFHSYHKDHVASLIEKKCKYVGDLVSDEMPAFLPENGKFYQTVTERVTQYFKSNGIDPKVDVLTFCRYAFFCVASLYLWYLCVAVHISSPLISMLVAAVSGLFTALVAMTVGHDGNHYAITHKPWVWTACFFCSGSITGYSSLSWRYQHNYGHHMFTNIDGADPDIHTNLQGPDVRRIKPRQSWFPTYRIQHLYMPIIYPFLAFKMKFEDFYTFYVMKKATIRINPLTAFQMAMFIGEKAFHVLTRFILPCFFVPVLSVVILNLAADIVTGMWQAVISQITHVNSMVEWPEEKYDKPWAEMQIATTVDFATDSWFWSMITGTVNHQVAHHLFPGVLQTYYPHITPIVRQTCAEFGLKYNSQPTVWDAVMMHFGYLNFMGVNPKNKE